MKSTIIKEPKSIPVEPKYPALYRCKHNKALVLATCPRGGVVIASGKNMDTDHPVGYVYPATDEVTWHDSSAWRRIDGPVTICFEP